MNSFIKPEKRKGIIIISIITLIIIGLFLVLDKTSSYISIDRVSYITILFLGILTGSVYLYGIYPLIGAIIGWVVGSKLEQAYYSCPPCPEGVVCSPCPSTPLFITLTIAIVGWLVGLLIAILINYIKKRKQKTI